LQLGGDRNKIKVFTPTTRFRSFWTPRK